MIHWNGVHYRVQYHDGDSEELDLDEVSPLVVYSEGIANNIRSVEESQKQQAKKCRINIPLRRSPSRHVRNKFSLPDDKGLRSFSEPLQFRHRSYTGQIEYDVQSSSFILTSSKFITSIYLSTEGLQYLIDTGLRLHRLPTSDSEDDKEDELYNKEREEKLKLDIEKAGCQNRRGKPVTVYQIDKEKNTKWFSDIQDLDECPNSVEDIPDSGLAVFFPRSIGKRQRYPPKFRFENKVEVEKAISTVYHIMRGIKLQFYGGVFLNISLHGTSGPNGREVLHKRLPNVRRVDLHSNIDWDYCREDPYQPIVINSRKWQLDGAPFLDMVNNHFDKLLPLLPEAVELMEVCTHRKMALLNLAATNLAAYSWNRKEIGVDPGVTPITLKASPELRRWFGDAMIILSYHFRRVVHQMDMSVKMYEITPSRRRLLNIVAKALEIPEDSWDRLLISAMSLTMNKRVGVHADTQSDFRDSFQYTTTATRVFESKELPGAAQEALESKGYLDRVNVIGMIGYPKAFIGDMAETEELGKSVTFPGYQYLVDLLSNPKNEYGYQSFLENKHRFQTFWKEKRHASKKSTYNGYFAKRLECQDLMAINSSFLDRNYNYILFLRQHNILITYYEWLQIWAATFAENCGQHFHYKIFSKWMSGNALDGENFFEYRERCRCCILYMYCCELYYYSGDKSYFKGSMTDSRFTSFGMPLCRPASSNEDLIEQISFADSYIERLKVAVIDRLCAAQGSADIEHESLHEDIKETDIPRIAQGGVVFHRCVQMAAGMMLIPTKFVLCGRVYGYGPFKFCKKFLGDHISLDDANIYFNGLYREMCKTFRSFSKSNLEQTLCSDGRKHRKYDLFYEDPATGKVQNFFLAKKKSENVVEMRVLIKGMWKNLEQLFYPFYKMKDKENSTIMDVMKERKGWYMQFVSPTGCLFRLPQDMWV